MTNWMTAAGIALIAGGLAILIGFRHLLWARSGHRAGARNRLRAVNQRAAREAGSERAALGAVNQRAALGAGNERIALGAINELATLGTGNERPVRGVGNERAVLGVGNERAVLRAGNEREVPRAPSHAVSGTRNERDTVAAPRPHTASATPNERNAPDRSNQRNAPRGAEAPPRAVGLDGTSAAPPVGDGHVVEDEPAEAPVPGPRRSRRRALGGPREVGPESAPDDEVGADLAVTPPVRRPPGGLARIGLADDDDEISGDVLGADDESGEIDGGQWVAADGFGGAHADAAAGAELEKAGEVRLAGPRHGEGHGEPRHEKPQHGEPADGTPRHAEPTGGTPQHEEPADGTPRHAEPTGGTPQHGEPADGTPRHAEPTGGTPRHGEPTGGKPADRPADGDAVDDENGAGPGMRMRPARRTERYGDRIDGWVRPQYREEPEPGEYWTPVPESSYADAGYGWPVPVERLPPVPTYPPQSGFDGPIDPAVPTALVPVWPPAEPSGRIELPRTWAPRNRDREVDDREPAPPRRRPRPRTDDPDRSTVYRSRHAADPG